MKRTEEIKKAIAISPAVIALLWAILAIIHDITHGYPSGADTHDIITIIGLIVVVPISILVIFNIKLPQAMGRPLAVVSILGALSYLAILFRLLFLPAVSLFSYIDILCSTIFILFYVPAIITFAIYAIRTLKPTGQAILIFIGILCAVITAVGIMHWPQTDEYIIKSHIAPKHKNVKFIEIICQSYAIKIEDQTVINNLVNKLSKGVRISFKREMMFKQAIDFYYDDGTDFTVYIFEDGIEGCIFEFIGAGEENLRLMYKPIRDINKYIEEEIKK